MCINWLGLQKAVFLLLMNLIEFDNGAFKDEKYGTIKYGPTNLTKNSIMQQYCDKLSYIKGMYDYQKPLN